jgi:hypothetical protein
MKKQTGLPAARLPARQGRQGFTIVELIIYTGILTIFLYVLTNIFTSVLDMQLESESTGPVVADGRYILSRFTYDITHASAIITPSTLGGESTSLVLRVGASDYTYSLSNGNLTLTTPLGAADINSYGSRVSNVSFRRYGNAGGKNSVRIVFTLTSTTTRQSGSEIRDYQTTIGLK